MSTKTRRKVTFPVTDGCPNHCWPIVNRIHVIRLICNYFGINKIVGIFSNTDASLEQANRSKVTQVVLSLNNLIGRRKEIFFQHSSDKEKILLTCECFNISVVISENKIQWSKLWFVKTSPFALNISSVSFKSASKGFVNEQVR